MKESKWLVRKSMRQPLLSRGLMSVAPAVLDWVKSFQFGSNISSLEELQDGIIFEKLLSIIEGNTYSKENWETYVWNRSYFKKRLASVYFKLGCGQTLESVYEKINDYMVSTNFSSKKPNFLGKRKRVRTIPLFIDGLFSIWTQKIRICF